MKRTAFHKCLLGLAIAHDYDHGITGLCEASGIPYQTMRKRLVNPRAMRWYEYLSIVDCLRLSEAEEASLIKSIKEFK